MKKAVYFVSILVIVLGFIFFMRFANSHRVSSLISPLVNKSKVLGANLWLPNTEVQEEAGSPQITAKAAFFIESKTGQVLFTKNVHQKLPIASLAKVMTVLIALEHKNLEDEFWVSEKAASMEPDKMLLIPGEKLILKDLLYGIFLISANDAAEVLAEEVTGGKQQFINLMNLKAQQLGMQNTHYVNPTGLDEDLGSSSSTAYDLAILTRHIIRQFPEVVEISKTEHVYLPITPSHQDYDMYSGINLLTTYPGVVGFKTGYTAEAGYTLITLVRKNGHEVIGVLLDSQYRRDEARELLDYSFKKLGV